MCEIAEKATPRAKIFVLILLHTVSCLTSDFSEQLPANRTNEPPNPLPDPPVGGGEYSLLGRP